MDHTDIRKNRNTSLSGYTISTINLESSELSSEQLDEIYAKIMEMIAVFKKKKGD